ncbi:uncharacterized protein LOC143233474 [Tachypleus tridentatus]|uniref:uncharacterized protein LOC143233474 n=1 Tax=Tachypleus tridentatus TaxID=6853 RepID=UPI003FCFE3F5
MAVDNKTTSSIQIEKPSSNKRRWRKLCDKLASFLGFHIPQSNLDPILRSRTKHTLCKNSDVYTDSFQNADIMPSWSQQMMLWNSDLCHSVDDLLIIQSHCDDRMLTIEGLRCHYSCCFSCGVNWADSHVSLDCFECGGYAMQRPCLVCDGKCKSVWSRNVTASHDSRQAKWEGRCYRSSGKLQDLRKGFKQDDNCEFLTKDWKELRQNL